jgi:uncharacterized protein
MNPPSFAASPSTEAPPSLALQPAIRDTVQWLERAVIGLNLCPFAKGVHAKGQIHYAVSQAQDAQQLLADLRGELLALAGLAAAVRDTTLLVVPTPLLADFLDFNDFLGEAEDLLEELELDGVLQIASFHPQFQFAGTRADDVTNCTNRSPYPTLHLLREESIDRAVEVFPEAETIYERNIEVLEQLGLPGWEALHVGPSCAAATAVAAVPDVSTTATGGKA